MNLNTKKISTDTIPDGKQSEYYTEEQSAIIKQKLNALKPKARRFYSAVIVECLLSLTAVILRTFDYFDLPVIKTVLLILSISTLVLLVTFGIPYFKALKQLKKELERFE